MKRLLTLLLLIPTSAIAAGVEDCARTENQSERLACFDRRYPNPERVDAKPTEPAITIEAESATEPAVPSTKAPSAKAPPSEAVTERAGEDPAEVTRGALFGKDPVLSMTTTIKALRRRDSQKMVFLLDNDQVWMQTTPRVLPFHEGDKVTIDNGLMGGYFMESSSGVITRVKRIQ